ncbi:MAG: hypothetical protein ACFE0I_02590 [Elainellaceae cyanobacterium]
MLPQFDGIYPQEYIDRIEEILTELNEIDAALKSARGKSMARKVEGLELSYGQHVMNLKSDGSNLLHEIASILNVSIARNKYSMSRSILHYQ